MKLRFAVAALLMLAGVESQAVFAQDAEERRSEIRAGSRGLDQYRRNQVGAQRVVNSGTWQSDLETDVRRHRDQRLRTHREAMDHSQVVRATDRRICRNRRRTFDRRRLPGRRRRSAVLAHV